MWAAVASIIISSSALTTSLRAAEVWGMDVGVNENFDFSPDLRASSSAATVKDVGVKEETREGIGS